MHYYGLFGQFFPTLDEVSPPIGNKWKARLNAGSRHRRMTADPGMSSLRVCETGGPGPSSALFGHPAESGSPRFIAVWESVEFLRGQLQRRFTPQIT